MSSKLKELAPINTQTQQQSKKALPLPISLHIGDVFSYPTISQIASQVHTAFASSQGFIKNTNADELKRSALVVPYTRLSPKLALQELNKQNLREEGLYFPDMSLSLERHITIKREKNSVTRYLIWKRIEPETFLSSLNTRTRMDCSSSSGAVKSASCIKHHISYTEENKLIRTKDGKYRTLQTPNSTGRKEFHLTLYCDYAADDNIALGNELRALEAAFKHKVDAKTRDGIIADIRIHHWLFGEYTRFFGGSRHAVNMADQETKAKADGHEYQVARVFFNIRDPPSWFSCKRASGYTDAMCGFDPRTHVDTQALHAHVGYGYYTNEAAVTARLVEIHKQYTSQAQDLLHSFSRCIDALTRPRAMLDSAAITTTTQGRSKNNQLTKAEENNKQQSETNNKATREKVKPKKGDSRQSKSPPSSASISRNHGKPHASSSSSEDDNFEIQLQAIKQNIDRIEEQKQKKQKEGSHKRKHVDEQQVNKRKIGHNMTRKNTGPPKIDDEDDRVSDTMLEICKEVVMSTFADYNHAIGHDAQVRAARDRFCAALDSDLRDQCTSTAEMRESLAGFYVYTVSLCSLVLMICRKLADDRLVPVPIKKVLGKYWRSVPKSCEVLLADALTFWSNILIDNVGPTASAYKTIMIQLRAIKDTSIDINNILSRVIEATWPVFHKSLIRVMQDRVIAKQKASSNKAPNKRVDWKDPNEDEIDAILHSVQVLEPMMTEIIPLVK